MDVRSFVLSLSFSPCTCYWSGGMNCCWVVEMVGGWMETGRAMSMTRLDQLSKPIRRNGEHICAIVEREKRMHLEANGEQLEGSLGGGSDQKRMSRSMTHLAAAATGNQKRTSSSSGLQKSASTVKVGGRNAMGGSKGSGGRGGLKPAKSLCHLDGSGGPGFHKIITKVAQHFIRNGNNARGKKEEDGGAKTGSLEEESAND